MAQRRKPLTEKDLLQFRERWGQDRVINTLLWEIARLRDVVRTLHDRTLSLHGYIPPDIIVPPDPRVDRVTETEPAINDEIAKQRLQYDAYASDREIKRRERASRG